MIKAVLDTNIFVAASFNKQSSSAKILEEAGTNVLLVWNDQIYEETKHILKKIPPISWKDMKKYFDDKNKYNRKTNPDKFKKVEDKSDRKFIALASSSNAVMVSNDEHLLSVKNDYKVEVLTSSEFTNKYGL